VAVLTLMLKTEYTARKAAWFKVSTHEGLSLSVHLKRFCGVVVRKVPILVGSG
jgi:hypothetical protein